MAQKYTIHVNIDSTSDDAKLKEFTKNLEALNAKTEAASGGASKFGSSLSSLKGVIGAFLGAGVVVKLVGWFRDIVSASAEAEVANVKLEAVLKATKGAAGITANEVKRYADRLQATTGISDEVTKSTAALMLTFKGIKGPAFFDAMDLVADMSVLFGDMNSAALQLGKALEDPKIGLTALRRVGISFTEQEQELITSLVESGRLFEAQAIIIEAIRGQLGGLAQEVGKTARGEWQIFKETLGDVAEKFGDNVTQSNNMRVALHWLTEQMRLLNSEMSGGIDAMARGKFREATEWAEQEAVRRGLRLGVAPIDRKRGSGSASAVSAESAAAAQAQIEKLIGAEENYKSFKLGLLQSLTKGTTRYLVNFRAYHAAEEAIRQKSADAAAAEAQSKMEWSERQTEEEILNAQKRLQAEQYIAAQEILLQEQKQAALIGGAQALIGALGAAFGEHKGFAVAMAIIDTYLSAAQALASPPGPPWTIPLAAAMIIQGFARVKAIRSTEIGGGGGGESGGSRPSAATNRSPTSGFGTQLSPPAATRSQAQPGPSNTTNVTYNINALTGSDAAETMRRFERNRRPASRAYDRVSVNRGTTQIGRPR